MDLIYQLRDNDNLRKIMILSSICTGMILQFSSPMGGIIFAIEISTSSFQVSNLQKFFVGACFSALIIQNLHFLLGMKSDIDIFINENINVIQLSTFSLLGLIIGLIVSLYIWIFNQYFKFRQQTRIIFFKNRYLYITWVSLLISIFCYYHLSLVMGYKSLLFELVAKSGDITREEYFHFRIVDSYSDQVKWMIELAVLFLIKNIMVIGFSTCSIPNGIMTPAVVLGLLFGRLFGEIFSYLNLSIISPRIFALAGAAAYLTGITKVNLISVIFRIYNYLGNFK